MMNKFGMVLGATVIASLAGCKDPDYVSKFNKTSQDEVKNVATEAAPVAKPVEAKPVAAPEIKPIETVPAKPIAAPEPAPAVQPIEPAYTMYTVRRGDYLAKISKKYNVTINSIKRLNPQMKGDTVCIGQKIKLPGVIDVEAAPVESAKPVAAAGAAKTSRKGVSDYTGATVEYTVKNGDTLGGIAYGHGINIRQLKKLNNLTGDSLKIGQKLKVPANGKPSAKAAKAAAPAVAPAPAAPAPAAPAAEVAPAPAADAAPAPAADAATSAPAAAAPASAPAAAAPAPALKTYVVQEGEDMAAVSVAWGVTASQIRELNNLGENDQLKPGQTIRLPAEADQQ